MTKDPAALRKSLEAFFGTSDIDEMAKRIGELQDAIDQVRREADKQEKRLPPSSEDQTA